MQREIEYRCYGVDYEWHKHYDENCKLIQIPKFIHKHHHKLCAEQRIARLRIQCVDQHEKIILIRAIGISENPTCM